jgi:alanyl-tRNA synthetase
LPKEDNWWGPAGVTGPCGPDSEMYYHVKDIQETSDEEFLKLNGCSILSIIIINGR